MCCHVVLTCGLLLRDRPLSMVIGSAHTFHGASSRFIRKSIYGVIKRCKSRALKALP